MSSLTPIEEIEIAPIPERARKSFRHIQNVIEMGATTSHLAELVQIKKNLFLNSMQYLRIVLSVGYYSLLIPFRIADDEDGFKLVTHPVQTVSVFTFTH